MFQAFTPPPKVTVLLTAVTSLSQLAKYILLVHTYNQQCVSAPYLMFHSGVLMDTTVDKSLPQAPIGQADFVSGLLVFNLQCPNRQIQQLEKNPSRTSYCLS